MNGFVVGKFAPFHLGHQRLIEFAVSQVEHLVVAVIDSPVENFDVPATTRAEWIRETNRGLDVRVMPDIRADERSDLWAEYTIAFLGYVPDAVITSEDYGEDWAQALGCEHISYDPSRILTPISATQVRHSPQRNLRYLPPVVRAHYVPRIVVIGAESTGTTTLAKALAEHYGEPCVEEYGRIRDEVALEMTGRTCEWTEEEFYFTAVMQQLREDQAALKAKHLLICDTDAWATYLWQDRYLGTLSAELAKLARSREYDLYLVTDHVGVAEEDDGLRFEMHKRPQMTQTICDRLTNEGREWRLVSGSPELRLQHAIRMIESLVKERAA